MSQHVTSIQNSRIRSVVIDLLFCLACILINFTGMKVASLFSLPLYLDCVGTLLAAALGGYVPGVLVGYCTNLVNTIIDPTSLYYAVISMLIAVTAAYLSEHGWFKSLPKILASIVIFAFFGGGVASLLTWNLFGFSVGNGTTSSLVVALRDGSNLSPMLAQLAGDFAVDLLDKSIVVIAALLIKRLLPKRLSDLLQFKLWLQRPLSKDELHIVAKNKPRTASIRTKIAIVVSVVMVSLVVVTSNISFVIFNESMLSEQTVKAEGILNLASEVIDPSRVDDYLEKGDKAEGYKRAEESLARIRDSFDGVRYLYVYRILEDGCHVVLDPDTAEEPGSEPGDVIEFDQAFLPYLDDLLAGREIEPVVSDEEYGWLVTLYRPIYNEAGSCVCYVAVDISMESIVSMSHQFIARIVSLFSAFFIFICVLVLWAGEYSIVLPINAIAYALSRVAFNTKSDRVETIEYLRGLNVHTGDETERLYDGVVKTAEDMMVYIGESNEKSETIERMQDNLIMVMADLVESRDQFTGDHVRKTAEYTRIIMRQMKREGIYADCLTDEFMSDVYHSAPLHDIGKIVVSDTILNKPGRLTKDEFEIMKSHTTAGRKIIDKAVSAVSEPTYLDEAKNLAEFHHEKWDGSGYPTGLAGEDIPLSARIMAVADVFDALVSKRSYKDGFPIEKAFAIIEEGKGTHFDPTIAQAFLDARDEVFEVVRQYGDGQVDKDVKE